MTLTTPELELESAVLEAQNAAFVAAWNHHDAKALTALHAEDADSVAPWHGRISGRPAIAKALAERHAGAGLLRDSTFTKTIDSVRFPSDDVAITDATAVVKGTYNPDGSRAAPATSQVTEVWKKTGGTWLIWACRICPKQAETGR